MKKEKNSKDEKLEVNQADVNESVAECGSDSGATCENTEEVKADAAKTETDELKAKLDEKARQCEEYINAVQRTAAEFDNYKKRTVKEKEALSLDVSIDIVNAFLPVVDNLERALKAAEDMENNPLKDGVEMVMRQMKDCMEKLGVEPIEAVGNQFNPELHNAVMHDTDEENEDNVVVEEFQKGYIMKGKVVRHSMVKVVN